MVFHPGPGLGSKILDDHFLEMLVGVVQVSQVEEGFQSLASGLADADQNARGERDRGRARITNDHEASRRFLVGRSEMRTAFSAKTVRRTFQHQAL